MKSKMYMKESKVMILLRQIKLLESLTFDCNCTQSQFYQKKMLAIMHVACQIEADSCEIVSGVVGKI